MVAHSIHFRGPQSNFWPYFLDSGAITHKITCWVKMKVMTSCKFTRLPTAWHKKLTRYTCITMTTLPLWTLFPNCLGTCSTFTMKLLYVCCVSFRQPAHVRSLDTPLQLDVSHCVLLQGKAQQIHSQDISSDGFSSGRCWQDLLQNRGWWRRLD